MKLEYIPKKFTILGVSKFIIFILSIFCIHTIFINVCLLTILSLGLILTGTFLISRFEIQIFYVFYLIYIGDCIIFLFLSVNVSRKSITGKKSLDHLIRQKIKEVLQLLFI